MCPYSFPCPYSFRCEVQAVLQDRDIESPGPPVVSGRSRVSSPKPYTLRLQNPSISEYTFYLSSEPSYELRYTPLLERTMSCQAETVYCKKRKLEPRGSLFLFRGQEPHMTYMCIT